MKKILSILLTLAMVFTIMLPNMNVIVKAEGVMPESEFTEELQSICNKVDDAADDLIVNISSIELSFSVLIETFEARSFFEIISWFYGEESGYDETSFTKIDDTYTWYNEVLDTKMLYTIFTVTLDGENVKSVYYKHWDERSTNGEFLFVAPHSHTWSYVANGETLKAWCDTTGCSSEHTTEATAVSLTLTANSANYSSISGLEDFNTATGNTIAESDVKFYKVETEGATTGGSLVEGTPTEAGYYYASLTVEGATAVKAFTIEAPALIEAQNFTLTKTADGYKVTAMPCSLPEKITEEAKSSYWLVWWGISDDDAAIIDEDYAGQTVWNLFSNSMSGMIGQVEMGDPSAGSEDGELMHFNRDWSESLNISYSGTEELKWLIVFKVVDYEVDEGYEDLDNICTMGGTNSIPTVINQSTGNMLGGGDGLPEVSIIYKNSNDFDVTSDTPSKTFTQGETSLSTIHIDGLTPEKVGSADNGFIGILVKNGNYTLQYGEDKDYTITNGSLQVNLTKKYLDNLLAGTHDVKVYVKLDGQAKTDDNDYVFDVNVIINAKSAPAPTPEPSNPGSSPRPGYRAPNTGVVGTTTVMTSNGLIEIGALALGSVIGLIFTRKKKEDK